MLGIILKLKFGSMTHAELESVILEAGPILKGRRVLEFRDVQPPEIPLALAPPQRAGSSRSDRVFVMLLRAEEAGGGASPHRILRLLISLTPDLNYLLVTQRSRPKARAGEGSPLSRAIDAALSGARLTGLRLASGDRIVTLAFEDREGRALTLTAKLYGRHPDLVLTDDTALPLAETGGSPPERIVRFGASAGAEAQAPASAHAPAPTTAGAAAGAMALNEAADAFFSGLEERKHLEDMRSACGKRLRRDRKRCMKKIADTEARIGRAEDAEAIREQGETLKIHFHLLERGMNSFEPPGGGESVPLDPALDPAGNLRAIFKRYRKLKRSLEPLEELLARSRRILKALDAGVSDLEAAGNAEDVAALAARFWPQAKAWPKATKQRERPDRRPSRKAGARLAGRPVKGGGIRLFRAPDGAALLVGRDGETNHRLLQAARCKDVWLHCHDTPGAHVVIPLEKGKTANLEALLAAGMLAVHFSKRRGADRADVIYTERRHVRALKGAPRGTVTVDRFKTLHVKADAEKLQTILETLET